MEDSAKLSSSTVLVTRYWQNALGPWCKHRSYGLEELKKRPIGQPTRPRTRYCSIG
jgi:hypothetical protein